VIICKPQIPHGLSGARTRASALTCFFRIHLSTRYLANISLACLGLSLDFLTLYKIYVGHGKFRLSAGYKKQHEESPLCCHRLHAQDLRPADVSSALLEAISIPSMLQFNLCVSEMLCSMGDRAGPYGCNSTVRYPD
jgi:hypothetical protein